MQQKLPDRGVSKGFLTQKSRRGLGALACAVVLLTISCSRQVEPLPLIAVDHEVSPAPAQVGPVTVTLKLSDSASKPITGARIAVEADMSHAGMSPRFAEAKETDPGRYRAHLEFPMAGDWIILLHVTLPDGTKRERQFDVRGVRPN